MRLHCDGARLFNACEATHIEPRYYARQCDSLCFCLSKGLGAPAGSLLLGDPDTMHRARRYRKMLGGGMRQAGVLAAAGLYALQHHIPDLADDHRRARTFRRLLEQEGFRFALPSPTNILYVVTPDAEGAAAILRNHGVLVLSHGHSQVRAVFHRDIHDDNVSQAAAAFRQLPDNLR